MKKLLSILLCAILLPALAACGGGGGNNGQAAPDLNKYYEDFMATLGADNTPAMMDVETDMIPQVYPGLENYTSKQVVAKMAAITAVPFEFVLLELESEADAQAAASILQARVDSQVNGGAFYPETTAAWEKAQVITHGNVAALICAGSEQDQAVDAFNKLFG